MRVLTVGVGSFGCFSRLQRDFGGHTHKCLVLHGKLATQELKPQGRQSQAAPTALH